MKLKYQIAKAPPKFGTINKWSQLTDCTQCPICKRYNWNEKGRARA